MSITSHQLGQLLPIVPHILAWLRQTDETAGDLFLLNQTDNKKKVNLALSHLVDNLNFKGFLTVSQIKEVCNEHGAQLWAQAVRVILADAEPRLVPLDVGSAMISKLPVLDRAETASECSHILGPMLDSLPLSNYDTLGAFCALMRDTCEEPAQLACLCGPMFFTQNIASQALETTASAAAVMDLLIEECAVIFGRVAVVSELPALGDRESGAQSPKTPVRKLRTAFDSEGEGDAYKSDSSASTTASTRKSLVLSARQAIGSPMARLKKQLAPPSSPMAFKAKKPKPPVPPPNLGIRPPPGLMTPPTQLLPAQGNKKRPKPDGQMQLVKRKHELVAFYQWRDPVRADRVDLLFQFHSFPRIAHAIHDKYGMLPPGWRGELIILQKQGHEDMDWFDSTNDSAPIKALGNKASAASASHRRASKAGFGKRETEFNSTDKVVNEIVDSEQFYHDALSELLESYVKQIRAIATGRDGKEAKAALGLSRNEIEQVFGWRLEEVVDISGQFLAKLEVVDLVRSEPDADIGRVGLVGQTFLEIAAELHVYAPYVSSHKAGINAMSKSNSSKNLHTNQSTARKLKKIGSAARLIKNASGQKTDHCSFQELWTQISAVSNRLKGQSLQSLLMMPVQRIPRYRLLLSELLKQTPADHPGRPLVEEALDAICEAAKQINDALRQHEKLEKFFGAEEMITPVSSDSARTPTKKNQYKQVYNVV